MHEAVGVVVVVAKAIQIGGHQADRIEALLAAQGLAQLYASDLGECKSVIYGLQRTCEQRLLADQLLCELQVDEASAQKHQIPQTAGQVSFDNVRMGPVFRPCQLHHSWQHFRGDFGVIVEENQLMADPQLHQGGENADEGCAGNQVLWKSFGTLELRLG